MIYKYHDCDEEEGFDVVEKDGETYDIGEMLHGYCDLFALELGQKLKAKSIPFNYGVMVNEDGLVHAFILLKTSNSDENIYVDVRGMTTSEEDFFDEFDDFFSWKSLEYSESEYLDYMDTEKEFKKKLRRLHGKSLKEYFNMIDIREKAKKIIEAFPELYFLN